MQDTDIIKWECNNWYVRADGLVQIRTQNGGKVILNGKISHLWKQINYEISVAGLWNLMKGMISSDDFYGALHDLESYRLISRMNSTDEFDLIFG